MGPFPPPRTGNPPKSNPARPPPPSRQPDAFAISTGGSRPAAKKHRQRVNRRIPSPDDALQHVQYEAHYWLTHTMHPSRLFLLGMIIASCGCSTTYEHEIQRTLAERKRSSVDVALWTLEQNGILTSQEVEKIDCNGPYSKARPQIRSVQERLRKLPEEKLEELDHSLSNNVYKSSPAWPYIEWDGNLERKIMRRLGTSSNPQGGANGRQPLRQENILESPAAASRRSP
jgi:hypothetical protein